MLFRSHKLKLKLLEDHSCEAVLDLDAVSGLTELNLVVEEESGIKYITKFGVSVGPSSSKINIPSQRITIVPRHVVVNESDESIIVRQCYLEVCFQSLTPFDIVILSTALLNCHVPCNTSFLLHVG